MFWVVSLTLLISFISLLPIFQGLIRFPLDIFGKLWGYAPNQFLFLFVPFPVAAFTTFVVFSNILKKFGTTSPKDSILRWLFSNWPVVILIGTILVSLVTIADYFYTAKVFDRFEQEYAVKALESADILRNRIEQHLEPKERLQEQKNINNEAKSKIKSFGKEYIPTKQEILSLEPSVYMKLILNSQVQREWKLLNPTAHVLSTLQLFFVLVTAFVCFFSIAMVYLGIQDGYRMSGVVNVLTFSVISFSTYPLCYRYFIAEMKLITDVISTIGGDVLAFILISVAAGLVLTIDPHRRDFLSIFIRGLPFFFVIAPGAYLVISGPLYLRSIIGIDTNPGVRISLFIVMILLAAMIVLVSWPREVSNNI